MATDPLTAFYEWLSGAGSVRDAGRQQQAGIASGMDTIKQGGKDAMALLAPYLKGGAEDYGRLRDMTNSGYFNQAYPGSYQPPAPPQAASYKPTWNPMTQSYSNPGRQAYQAPTQDRVQMMSLPQFKSAAPPPQAPNSTQVSPPNAGPKMGLDVNKIMDIIMRTNPAPMQQNEIAPPQIQDALGSQNPASNPNWIGRNPQTFNNQDFMRILMNRMKSGPTAPYGGTGGRF